MGEIGDRIADSCSAAESDVADFLSQLNWQDRVDTAETLYRVSQDRVVALSMLGFWAAQKFSPMDAEDVEISVEDNAKTAEWWSPCCWDAVPMNKQQADALSGLIADESSRVSDNDRNDSEDTGGPATESEISADDRPDPWLGYAETEKPSNEFSD